MNKTLKSILFWIPRILGILFILFISVFSLDVFGTGAGFWATLLGFIIHNLPGLILLAALLIGWHWEWVGALGFLVGAGWFLSMGSFELMFVLVFVCVPALVGILFLIGWFQRKKHGPSK